MKLKYLIKSLSLLSGSALFLAACSSGSVQSQGGGGSTAPIGGAHVEADVVNGKIYEVREYAFNGNGQLVQTFAGLPHGTFVYHHPDQLNYQKVTHYYHDMNSYKSERAKLDQSYANSNTVNSGKLNSASNSFSGFDIGYNPAIEEPITNSGSYLTYQGVNQPYCYNTQIQINNSAGTFGFQSFSDFTATNGTSNNANTLSEKNNIAGSYGLFKGSNALAYSTSYQGSSSDGAFEFVNAAVANIGFTVNGLSNFGNNMLESSPEEFIQNCGSSTVSTIPMGWMVSYKMQLSADTSATTSSISDVLKASYSTLASMTNALSITSSSSTSSFSLSLIASPSGDYTFQGSYSEGGVTVNAGDDIQSLIAAAQISSGILTNCMSPSGGKLISSACKTSIANLSGYVTQIMSFIPADIHAYGLPADLSLVDAFPQGVTANGASIGSSATYEAITNQPQIMRSLTGQALINAQLIADPYAPSSSNLNNYVQLIWQIQQLVASANLYANILTNNNSANSPLLPSAGVLNAAVLFENLANAYTQDVNALSSIIGGCMADSTKCSSLPQLPVNDAYDYYNNSALYNTLEPAQNSSVGLTNKKLNAVLLTYNATTYNEAAALSSPGNVWSYVNDIDQWYVGNNNPEVQNSVPMAFIYVDSTNNVFANSGILGVALNGLSMANPFCAVGTNCTYEFNGQTNMQSGPLQGYSALVPLLLPETPFYYFLRENGSGFAGLIGQSIGVDTNLSNYFMMAQKYVNGTEALDFPNDTQVYYTPASTTANPYPAAATTINISPNSTPPSPFSISSYGAAGQNASSIYSVNGVFGPVGDNSGLYALIKNGSQYTVSVTALDPQWILGIPDVTMQGQLNNRTGCYGGHNAVYNNYGGCDGTGLYPYSDSQFTAPGAGALATTINSTTNTVEFKQSSSGFFN
ncbi:MAG: hypothetical protein E6Q32_10555 [Neisseriales bacterium]|nr:MAG: hypothetical protein E6Q32_10555 [Neisseriales bacterium]